MRAIVVVCAFAACGRGRFDTTPADATVATPKVVQRADQLIMAGAQAVLPIAATGDGDLIVVATVDIDNTSSRVTSIADDAGNTYVSANALYTKGTFAVGEIWYATSSVPGATRVTIDAPQLTRREIWLLEVSGATLRDEVAVAMDLPQSAGPLPAPTIAPTQLPAFVLSMINVSGSVTGLQTGSPFIAMTTLNGDQAAFEIVDVPGDYGAQWVTGSTGMYSAATVAFR